MRRKNRERRTSKPHGLPPPPPLPPLPPRPEEWGDGFVICVQFSRMIDKTASFLRLDPQFNGPFTSDLTVFCSTSIIGSVVYGLDGGSVCNDCDDNCHCFRHADFGQMVPTWNITKQLLCHRSSPKVVTVKNDLYVFDESGIFAVDDVNCPSSSHPFGFLFNPTQQCSTKLPFCEFHTVGIFDLVVAPVGQNLLILDKQTQVRYFYDTEKSTWNPFDLDGILDHIAYIEKEPVSVPEHNTIYWIDRHGDIKAFNWVNLTLFEGPIVGFGEECIMRGIGRYHKLLLHLEGELFCLLWSDPSATLHISIVRICLDIAPDTSTYSPRHLTASVIGCFCYHLDSPINLKATHLLR
ncbi:hypothetical protein RND81_13G167400 [Saponaria officinalis]|uniref:F-box protein n=3 Tax=Saponaria officinalis TaxID=3572 RepID=A0AAW1GYP1_SAPOF